MDPLKTNPYTTARRPCGTTVYRNQYIAINKKIPLSKKGRYTWNGREFALLGLAKAAIDEYFRNRVVL